MSKNGIIIDVGFKTDVKGFVNDIQNDFKKIDFDNIIGLSESFDKQEQDVRKKLKELSEEIDKALNGKLPNNPDEQLKALNKAVQTLSSSMKDMIKSMPSDQVGKFSGNISNITSTMNELSQVCGNAAGAVKEIQETTGQGVQFVDSSQRDKLKEIFKLLERGNQALEKFDTTRNKHGNKPYDDEEDALRDIIAQNAVYENSLKEIEAIEKDATLSSEQRVEKLDKAYATFAQTVSGLSRTINTFANLHPDGMSEALKEMIPSDLTKSGEKSLKKIQDQLEGYLNQMLDYIATRKAEIQKEYYDLGGTVDLQKMFEKGTNKQDTIKVPVSLKTSAKTLLNQTMDLISIVQKGLNDSPLQVEVQLMSTYKTKRNQEYLNQIKESLDNITDEELKSKALEAIDKMNRNIDNALLFNVNVNTENAKRSVDEFVKNAKDQLALLSSELAPLEPEVILTEEHRKAFQQQLEEAKSGFTIQVGILDGEDTIDNNATKKELTYIKLLRERVEAVEEAVNNKSLAFVDEGEIVQDVVTKESDLLNHLYGDLVSIEEQIKDIIAAFSQIPTFKFDIDTSSISSLTNLANNDVLAQIITAKQSINEAMASNIDLGVEISDEQKAKLEKDILSLTKYMNEMFNTDSMKHWSSEFKDSLDEISNKIKTLFGDNALNEMIDNWNFSDELMKKINGNESVKERSGVIASDGKIYGSGTHDQHGSTRYSYDIAEEIIKMGLQPTISMHSHSSDRIAASSMTQENSVGDLVSFYQKYIMQGIEKELTIALNDIEVFDAKGFYDSNKNINFNSSNIQEKIRKKKIEICSQINDNFFNYFEDFVNQYGSGDFLKLKDEIFKSVDSNILTNKLKDFIDPNVLLNNFFNETKNDNSNNLAAILNKSIRKTIKSFDKSSVGISNDEVQELYNNFVSQFYSQAKLILDKTFGISQFQYDPREGEDGYRDLWTYNFRRETPRILSEALEGTGYKNNYQDYIKSYTTDEFKKQNPLGLSSSTLSDMFDVSAPSGFLETLDKIVEDLTEIKNISASDSLKDIFNVKFDDSSLKDFYASINGIIDKINELVGITNNNNPKSQLKSMLKDFISMNQYMNQLASSPEDKTDEWMKVNDQLNDKFNTEFWAAAQGFDIDNFNTKNEKDLNNAVDTMIAKARELGISLEDLGVKEEKVISPLDKFENSMEQFSNGVDAFNKNIDKLIESLKILPELLSNVNNASKENTSDNIKLPENKIDESINNEGNTINLVVNNEIEKLKELEKQIDSVTAAVDNKTEAFKKEGEVVNGIVNGEIEKLNPLESLQSSYETFKPFYDNGDLESEAGANAALSYYNAYKDALASKVNKKDLKQYTIGNMDELFTGNYSDYKRGIGELDLTGLTEQINKYQEIVDKLNQPEVVNVINAISEAIRKLMDEGSNSDGTTEFLQSLNKVINNLSNNKSAEKIQKITDNLTNFKKSLEIIDTSDSGVLKSLSSILEKGEELKALGAVLKSTKKQIDSAGKEVKSKDNYNKSSEYLRNHENDITDSVNKAYGSNGDTVLYQKLSATNLGEEGQTFTPDSKNWDELVAKAKEFGIELSDIQKIVRNVDREGYESFQLFTELSRITVGMDSTGVLFQNDNVLDKSIVDKFKKEISELPKLLSGAFKGDQNSLNLFLDGLNDVQSKWETISKLSKKDLIDKDTLYSAYNYINDFKQTLSSISIDKIETNGRTDAFITQIEQAKNQLESLSVVFDKIHTNDIITDEDTSKIKDFANQIKNLFDTVNDKNNKMSGEIAPDKLFNKLYDTLEKNTAMSKELRHQFEELATEMNAFGGSIPQDKLQEFNERFWNLTKTMKETGQTGKSFFDMISSRAKGMSATFAAQFFSLYDIMRYARELIDVVKELDTAMVELRKVTSGTEEQYKKFKSTISETAKEVASTNADLISSAADWARLGYSIDEAADLAKNSAMFVNVGDGIDIEEATEDMISAMKAFNIQAEDSMEIVDAYNEVGNNFAISAGGIGEAMQRSASALSTANNSFAQSIALITAMNEVIQDTETTGTTLKVLSLRLRGASTEIEDMGESTDGMAESTSKLQAKIAALTNTDGKGGINILTDSGDFKSTYDIISGIASKWQDISDVNQAALLELIAGKTRANGVAALLNNWQKLGEVVESVDDSEGSATKENEAVINSIEGKITQFKASVEELCDAVVNSGLIKWFIDLGTTGVSALTKLIKTFVSLQTIIVALGAGVSVKFAKNGGGRDKKFSLRVFKIIICLRNVNREMNELLISVH